MEEVKLELPSLTAEQIEAEVLRLAAEYPLVEYIEQPGGCKYASGEAGPGQGCIFGQALQALGVPLEVLREWDELDNSSIAVIGRRLGLPYVPTRWVEVQQSQDSQHRWEVATQFLREMP